jgi:predicted hotdog family 3-hydroxylacyl-ACP dehydratase
MAIKSQTAVVKVSTATAATKTITGITAANPGVVSASAHGYSGGDVVSIAAVVGMTEVNGRAFVVDTANSPQEAGTFEINQDTSAYTAYSSAGTAAKETMTAIGSVVGFQGFDGTADDIDVTHLQSTAKEFLVGLQDFGNFSFDLNLDNDDTGQAKLRALKSTGATGTFSVTLSNGEIAAFRAQVKSFTVSNTANDAARGSVSLRIASEPSWFS